MKSASAYRRYPFWRYLIAAGLALALVCGLNAISVFFVPDIMISNFRPFMQRHLQALSTRRPEAVNIGGSIATNLQFQKLGLNGVSFAFSGQDDLENVAVLDAVLARHPGSVKHVFFATEGAVSTMMEHSWSAPLYRRQFYRSMAPYRGWKLISHDWSNLMMSYLFPLVREDHWLPVIRHGLQLRDNRYRLLESRTSSVDMNTDTIISPASARVAEAQLETNMQLFQQARYYYPGSITDVRRGVKRMCDTVSRHHMTLIIYYPPVTDIYRRHIGQIVPKFRSEFDAWDKVMSYCKARGARIMHFDRDPSFWHRHDLFWDSYHLNAEGTELFNRKMRRRLEQMSIAAPQ